MIELRTSASLSQVREQDEWEILLCVTASRKLDRTNRCEVKEHRMRSTPKMHSLLMLLRLHLLLSLIFQVMFLPQRAKPTSIKQSTKQDLSRVHKSRGRCDLVRSPVSRPINLRSPLLLHFFLDHSFTLITHCQHDTSTIFNLRIPSLYGL